MTSPDPLHAASDPTGPSERDAVAETSAVDLAAVAAVEVVEAVEAVEVVGSVELDGSADELDVLDQLEADLAAVELAISTLDRISSDGTGGEQAASEIATAVSEQRFGASAVG